MAFHSYAYISLFLPLVVLLYHVLDRLMGERFRYLPGKILLITAGFLFYAWPHTYISFIVLLSSIVINYIFICLFRKKDSKAVFVIPILINISLLIFFKYTAFVSMPLGISFFTFQQISYLALIRNRTTADNLTENTGTLPSPVDYLTYILFFPKLLMGPLMEPEDLLRQLDDPVNHKWDLNNFVSGLKLISFGLFKKLLLADTLSAVVNWGFDNTGAASPSDWILITLCYTFQIYFDFSGYTDIATGSALMLNITLPINFDSPYKALSIRDFWKRWHISLTAFFTKYIYIPLGGSRKGLFRTCINVMIVFLISGFWHGSTLNFVLWGALYGSLCVLERLLPSLRSKMLIPLKWLYSFVIINLLWLLFRSESIPQWWSILRKIFSFHGEVLSEDLLVKFVLPEFALLDLPSIFWMWLVMGASFLICLIPENNYKTRKRLSVFSCILAAVTFCWAFLSLGNETAFLYFNF